MIFVDYCVTGKRNRTGALVLWNGRILYRGHFGENLIEGVKLCAKLHKILV